MASTVTRKKKPDAIDEHDVYVCVEPFAGTLSDGEPFSPRRGTRLLGGHEAVQRWPQYFAPDSDPEALNRPWLQLPEPPPGPPAPDVMCTEPPRPLQPIRLKRDVTVGDAYHGRTELQAGALFDEDSELARRHPQLFDWGDRPVPSPIIGINTGALAP